ncbi:MAG: SIS domain-containing protein [Candidatus Melainabacteria bacterium]|nr:SIS domain-containing protein [Candidatus Melainabacteria bacterium]
MRTARITLKNEICEQPALWRARLGSVADWLQPDLLPATPRRHWLALAEGSSRHALCLLAPWFKQWLGQPLLVMDPDEWLTAFSLAQEANAPDGGSATPAFIGPEDGLLVVSQSGETASVLRALEACSASAMPWSVAVVNKEHSTLARRLGRVLPVSAGEEKSIAATKSMTVTFVTLLRWALALAVQQQCLPEAVLSRITLELTQVSDQVSRYLQDERAAFGQMQQFVRTLPICDPHADSRLVLMSAGPLRLILEEAGLKITETCRVQTTAYNTESFKHGPKVLVSDVSNLEIPPMVLYAVPAQARFAEQVYEDIDNHAQAAQAAESQEASAPFPARLLRFENSLAPPDRLTRQFGFTNAQQFIMPPVNHALSEVLVGLVTFQILSYSLAALTGEPVNQPSLQKAVMADNSSPPEPDR